MVLPYVDIATNGLLQYQEYGPGQFKPLSVLGSFLGDPPIIPEVSPVATGAPVCMMSTSSTEVSQDMDSSSNDIEASATAASLVYAASQTPFLYPPPSFTSQQVLATLVLPNISLAFPVWYLVPPPGTPTTNITVFGL